MSKKTIAHVFMLAILIPAVFGGVILGTVGVIVSVKMFGLQDYWWAMLLAWAVIEVVFILVSLVAYKVIKMIVDKIIDGFEPSATPTPVPTSPTAPTTTTTPTAPTTTTTTTTP